MGDSAFPVFRKKLPNHVKKMLKDIGINRVFHVIFAVPKFPICVFLFSNDIYLINLILFKIY